MSEKPCVYFIQYGDGGPIKIGVTNGDVRKRRNMLQPGAPERLCVLGTVAGDRSRERALQRRFRSIRIGGEWFQATPELIAFIRAVATPLPAPPARIRSPYSQRLPAQGTKEDLERLRKLSRHLGISMGGVVRHLIREKAREEGLE